MKIKDYKIYPVNTPYIKPNQSLDILINNSFNVLKNGDYLIISETPISLSQGRIIDESKFKESLLSIFLAKIWSKYIWGYILGPIFKIKKRTIHNLRHLPDEAIAHKEVVIQLYGLKHALKPASEAGIDLSNVPGSFVSLLPEKPNDVAKHISNSLKEKGKNITVLIIDTDVTYELFGKKFTCLPIAIDGINCDYGFFGYLLGRFGKIRGHTPLGTSEDIDVDLAIDLANIAEEYQESLEKHFDTVHTMKKHFDDANSNDEVTIEMLDSIVHTPAVILRKV